MPAGETVRLICAVPNASAEAIAAGEIVRLSFVVPNASAEAIPVTEIVCAGGGKRAVCCAMRRNTSC